jgi:hypothetical protein
MGPVGHANDHRHAVEVLQLVRLGALFSLPTNECFHVWKWPYGMKRAYVKTDFNATHKYPDNWNFSQLTRQRFFQLFQVPHDDPAAMGVSLFREPTPDPLGPSDDHRSFGEPTPGHSMLIIPLAITTIRSMEDGSVLERLLLQDRGVVRGALKLQSDEVRYVWDSRFSTLNTRRSCTQKIIQIIKYLDPKDHHAATSHVNDIRNLLKLALFETGPNTIGPSSPTSTSGLPVSESKSMEEAWKLVDEQDGLHALLVFRAVVMATFLSTVADISCVVRTELGQRIVQFM